MAWAMVIAAGLLEMVWSYSAKRSDGFTRLGWAGLTVAASLASFFLLVFSMRRLPLGTAYAMWTGIGATGSFLVGIAALGESANSPALQLIGTPRKRTISAREVDHGQGHEYWKAAGRRGATAGVWRSVARPRWQDVT